MTRVIHTGDTHVGYQQYHSPERRQDFLDAFRQVIEDAIDDDVDAVVHAGDLFHDRRPGLLDLQGVIGALRELRAAGIPFLAVVGNHEGKRDAQWLDLFEDLDLAERLGREPRLVDDVAFYGLDFVPRSRRADLDYDFEPTDADHRVLVSHGLFEPFAHADWDTERLLAESTVEFDALLLGDNHHPGQKRVDDTLVTYCGSTERASADEREDRGYNILTADDDLRISRRGLDSTRPFVFVDLSLQEGEGEGRIREAVRQHDLEGAVVVVTVEGDGEPVTPAAIEEFALERGALVARLNDRRAVESETDHSVSFADPDEAVRDRIADLGLSPAAREIDQTVRDGSVADANVRETIERQVREHVDEAAFEAFESADDQTAARDDGATDDGDGQIARADQAAAGDETTGDDQKSDDGDEPGDDQEPENQELEDQELEDQELEDQEPDDDQTADGEATPADDGQASMEEYL